jgi:hypothetical protein
MRSRERTTEAKVVGIARGRAWRTLAGRGAGGREPAIRAPDTVVIHVGQELAKAARLGLMMRRPGTQIFFWSFWRDIIRICIGPPSVSPVVVPLMVASVAVQEVLALIVAVASIAVVAAVICRAAGGRSVTAGVRRG